jgi:hypothetical protein
MRTKSGIRVAIVCLSLVIAGTTAHGQAGAILVIPQNQDPTQSALSINFGNVNLTKPLTQTVYLWNVGSVPVSGINAMVSNLNGSAFTVNPTAIGQITAGSKKTVTVTFNPTTAMQFTGKLNFTASTGGMIPIPSVNLIGTGVSSNAFAVSPAYSFHGIKDLNGATNDGNVYFGTQSVGVTTCALKVYLSNGTGSPVTANASVPSGSFAISTASSNISVPSGVNTAALGVTYSPTVASTSPETATLTVTFPGGSRSITLSGKGMSTQSSTDTNAAQHYTPLIDMGNTRTYTPDPNVYTLQAAAPPLTGGLFDGNFGTSDTGCNSPSAYIAQANPTQASQDTIGRAFAAIMRPINGTTGKYDGTGNVVMLSIGMSNATDEWCGGSSSISSSGDDLCGTTTYHQTPSPYSLMQTASGLNQSLAIVNGAFSSQEACDYTFWSVTQLPPPPTTCTGIPFPGSTQRTDYDIIRDEQLTPHSPQQLYESQVQGLWIKQADVTYINHLGNDVGSYGCPVYAPLNIDANCKVDFYNLEKNLAGIVRAAKIRYPNLRMVFLTSRSYGGFTGFHPTNEMFAYETGFANKRLVKAQMDQMNNGGCSPVDTNAGDLNYLYTPGTNCTATGPESPWIVWDRLPSTSSLAGSTYIWAYTPSADVPPVPNSNGVIWPFARTIPPACDPNNPASTNTYFIADGQHPNDCGISQVGKNLLLNYFLYSPYTTPWFTTH